MKEKGIKDQIIDRVVIRSMEETDVEAASRLESSVFSMPWRAGDFLEMVKADYAYYFIADLDGQVVGICGLRDIVGEGEITNVAVDKDYRELGIGSKLMKKIIDQCGQLKINDVTLEVRASNQAAITLYESYGFKGEGIRPNFYDNPKEDALIMWRREC